MPSINDSLDFQRAPSSAFISPFSASAPSVLYSSITIPGMQSEGGSCLACAAQDLTSLEIEEILQQLVVPAPTSSVPIGLQELPALS